jgi:pyruvate/2-oxoglutarate dehydrogenase complex dihydrolipoamide dehydrogenase (E3) component
MEGHDLIVIGGGTSGFIVAIGALRLGLKVALIEKNDKLGGLSLHNGCVPSKTMLHVAHTAHAVRHAKEYGLDSYILPVDLGKINNHVASVVNNFVSQETHEVQHLFQQLGGQIIYGQPTFIDAHTVAVNDQELSAKKFVIASGSRPLFPSIKGLDDIGYITNDEVFKQDKLWDRLVILGGRPSAIEFAQAFERLGSKVAIIIRGDSILPQEDPELVNKIKDVLIGSGIDIYLNTKVQNVYSQRKNKVLECVHDSGEIFTVAADEILVALGRRPNVEGLGLENAGIKYAQDGILVDRRLRTSRKNIYALGDVIRSPYKLTHIAEYQASILLSNMLFRYPAKAKYLGFPYIIFTDPEFAHVGLTEHQAREHGYKKIEVFKFDFKDLDSAIIKNSAFGMIKVVTSRNKIIGASILGPHASNLIAEWGLAINMGARLSDVASTIHAYPTLAQINRRVASKKVARGFFSQRNRSLVSFLRVFA